MASGYNELEKVSAVETFQNDLGVSKWDEEVVSFRSLTKFPALEIFLEIFRACGTRRKEC